MGGETFWKVALGSGSFRAKPLRRHEHRLTAWPVEKLILRAREPVPEYMAVGCDPIRSEPASVGAAVIDKKTAPSRASDRRFTGSAPADAQAGGVPTEPLVSVLIVTYNHVDYLPAAIESVLAQRTTFPVEILISEDASTDGTRALAESWAGRHPDRFRLLLSERNVRSNEVVARGLRAASGRYVALLDGDDRWCDPGKLQRQADFLDANPWCTAVFHNALTAVGDLTENRWTRSDTGTRIGLETLMQGNPFATCTAMLRTDCVRDVPDWYAGFFPITDWPLYTFCALRGELAFVDEVSGVYRLHEGGAFSSRSAEAKFDAVEGFYRRLAQVAPSLGDAASNGCSRYFFDWAEASLAAGDLSRAGDCLRRSLRGGGVGRSVPRRAMLRLGMRLLAKWVRRP